MYTQKKYDQVGDAAKAVLYSHYRASAKRRKIDFELTVDEATFLFKGNCDYCGQPPNQRAATSTRAVQDVFVYNGIDRINSDLGYTVENCVPCCKVCNYAKTDTPHDEFIAWIRKAYKHLEGRDDAHS